MYSREIGGGGGGGEGIENLIDTEQKEAFAAIFSRLTRDGSRINLLDFQKLMFPKATPDETSSFFSVNALGVYIYSIYYCFRYLISVEVARSPCRSLKQ